MQDVGGASGNAVMDHRVLCESLTNMFELTAVVAAGWVADQAHRAGR